MKKGQKRKVVFTGFTVFLLFVLAFVLFFRQDFRMAEVKGPSMEPTFKNGDHVLVSKAYWLVGDLRPGDVVVIKPKDQPGEYFIKRIYATAGDKVDFYNIPDSWSIADGDYIVPADQYYVLGDNRPVSEDSRAWGPVERDSIIGKVIVLRPGIQAQAATRKD